MRPHPTHKEKTVSRAPIIHSLLDTDLYKFTMLQVVLHQFPQAHGVYEFRCRNNADTVYPLAEIKSDLEAELDALCTLKFTQDELDYLRGLRFIKSDFVDYLELFQLKRRFVTVTTDEAGRLHIRVEGPMIQAMFFEIYILAIVNELYFRRLETPEVLTEGERRLQEKAARLKTFPAAATTLSGRNTSSAPSTRPHPKSFAAPATFIWPKNSA